jgi:hypothetical protein
MPLRALLMISDPPPARLTAGSSVLIALNAPPMFSATA